MDGRASVVSLLLSIVVAMPCARKVICVPPDDATGAQPAAGPRGAAPSAAASTATVPAPKAAARGAEKTGKSGHCTATGQRTVAHTIEHTS